MQYTKQYPDHYYYYYGRLCPANTRILDSRPPLYPVHHQSSDFRGVIQSRVPLQRVYEGRVRSTSGLLPMSGLPQDQLASSELWVSHAMACESHAPLPDGVWQSWKISIQVNIPNMIFLDIIILTNNPFFRNALFKKLSTPSTFIGLTMLREINSLVQMKTYSTNLLFICDPVFPLKGFARTL